MRNETDLGPAAVASFVRGELAKSLRSRKPYTVNLLLGGLDPITKKPSLYWLDYLAALAAVPYAAHGYAQYVATIFSILSVGQSPRNLMLTLSQILLPIHPGQAPSSRNRLRKRTQDYADVYR